MLTATEVYRVGCPDVLEVQIEGRPELSGRRCVGPDGRIDLGGLGRLRVEGQAISDITRSLAEAAAVSMAGVRVRVAEYQSQHVCLVGRTQAGHHVVAYRGPETVVDLLRREGGIAPGAAPDEVYLVRSHPGDDKRPEVFRIDLRAILLQHDARSNIPVLPNDQLYVGETRTFSFEKCIPPWFRPIYEALVGMRKSKRESPKTQDADEAMPGPILPVGQVDGAASS